MASWDPWTGSQSPNPYTVFRGITTFDQSWPGVGPGSPHGLDSYAWMKAGVTGPQVTGPNPDRPGLAAEGMIGRSAVDGGLSAIVWLVNNDSTGGNPASPTDGYPVVPASSVTVSACSSCRGFVPGQTYEVHMWDTVTGTAIPGLSSVVEASPQGAVTLDVPAIATDIAVTITPR